MRYLPLTLLPLLVVACTDQDPVAPDTAPLFSAAAGMDKVPIDGWIEQSPEIVVPGRSLTTPSGICHLWDLPVPAHFVGSIVGDVIFHEQEHFKCDFSHVVGSGPAEAVVTWNELDGAISGQWTTNCKPDASQPFGISCDGTMNLRGSGDLEGVQFHMKWGPGWYPFPYTGTAFYK